jgi:hypothetical protein
MRSSPAACTAAPEQRKDKNGHPYTVAKVRAIAGNGAAVWIFVIAFDDVPAAALLALGDGDSVALCGDLTPMGLDRQDGYRPALPRYHRASSDQRVSRHPQAQGARGGNLKKTTPPGQSHSTFCVGNARKLSFV